MLFNKQQLNFLMVDFDKGQRSKFIKIHFKYTKPIYKLLLLFFQSGYISKYYIIETYDFRKKKFFKLLNIFFKYDNYNYPVLKFFRSLFVRNKIVNYSYQQLKVLYKKFNWVLNSYIILTTKGLLFFPEVIKLKIGGIILFKIK